MMNSLIHFAVPLILIGIYSFSASAQNNVTLESSVVNSNRRFACPGEEVVFDCTTTGLQILWTIPPLAEDNNPIVLLRNDINNAATNRGDGTVVAIVVDTDPFRSQLIVKGLSVSNTIVRCATTDTAASMPYEVAGNPRNPTVNQTGGDVGDLTNSVADLAWDPQNDEDIDKYVVVVGGIEYEAAGTGISLLIPVAYRHNFLSSQTFTAKFTSINKCNMSSDPLVVPLTVSASEAMKLYGAFAIFLTILVLLILLPLLVVSWIIIIIQRKKIKEVFL